MSERDDLATPNERRWLNRLEAVRPDMRPLTITVRTGEKDGQYSGLTTKFRRKRSGTWYGCYATANFAWVKKEVISLERQQRRKHAQEIRNQIGAFI